VIASARQIIRLWHFQGSLDRLFHRLLDKLGD
jgi:hypothetical protein